MQTRIFSFLVIALLAASCNSSKKAGQPYMNNNDITGVTWTLTTLGGQAVTADSEQDQSIHFVLQPDGKVTGYTGCNNFNGTYTLEDGMRIRFGKLASTRMACPDAPVKEFDFLQVFELTDNYTVNGNSLMLNVGRRAPLAVFTKNKTNESDITEKYWKLKTLEGQPVTMADNQEREAYFMLKSDGSVKGFAGCNTFNGSYDLEDGNRIRFSQMLATLRACPDVEVNESEFLQVFNQADNYTINGDMLMLNVGRRAPLAVFEAVYF